MHNAQSPDNSDAGIERDLLAKGLTAPRVTATSIEACIRSEYCFTAAGAAFTTRFVHIDDEGPLSLLTICVLVLKNGFTVVGTSAYASPENFDADIGRRIARADAINQVWALEGYALKTRLAAT